MEWLQILASNGLLLVGGIVGTYLKSKSDELRTIEERLQEQRKQVYAELLEPYIRLFSGIKNPKTVEHVTKTISSVEYRRTAFQLTLFADDEAVDAYNRLMQYTYRLAEGADPGSNHMLELFGFLLLAIRKSLGNKNTSLDQFDMLAAQVRDLSMFDRANAKTRSVPKRLLSRVLPGSIFRRFLKLSQQD